MVDLSDKQKEVLEDEVRLDLWETLKKARKPMSLSLLGAQKPFVDIRLAKLSYHLAVLVDAGLVELDGASFKAVDR